MRIGFEGVLQGGEETGVETAIRHTLYALAQTCPGDEIVAFVSKRAIPTLPSFPNVRYHEVALCRGGRPGRILWQQVVAPGLAQQLRLDLYHAPGYVLACGMTVPSVVTLYDTIAFDCPHLTIRSNRWHYRLTVPPGIRSAARVVAPTEHVRRRAVERLGADPAKVHVIPLGIAPHFIPLRPEESRRRLEQARVPVNGVPYGLVVGRKEAKKNLSTLLRAASTCENRALQLVFVGKDGGEGASLQALARDLGLADRVRWLPHVDDDTLVALYSNAAFLACASWEEGFGLTPLEAMACNTPVLLSDIQAHRETAGEAAAFVPPGEVGAWAEALDRLLTSPGLREDLVQRGRERVAQFSWEQHARQLREVYSLAVESRNTSCRH